MQQVELARAVSTYGRGNTLDPSMGALPSCVVCIEIKSWSSVVYLHACGWPLAQVTRERWHAPLDGQEVQAVQAVQQTCSQLPGQVAKDCPSALGSGPGCLCCLHAARKMAMTAS